MIYDIFRDVFFLFVEFFIVGYNVCVLVFGEMGFGKLYFFVGEKNLKVGFIFLIINFVFMWIKNE